MQDHRLLVKRHLSALNGNNCFMALPVLYFQFLETVLLVDYSLTSILESVDFSWTSNLQLPVKEKYRVH